MDQQKTNQVCYSNALHYFFTWNNSYWPTVDARILQQENGQMPLKEVANINY